MAESAQGMGLDRVAAEYAVGGIAMNATKAAIEKNYPFLCSLETWWNMILKYGDTKGDIRRARNCLHGAAMYAAADSEQQQELLFLRDLLMEQRDVYERMEAKEVRPEHPSGAPELPEKRETHAIA